MTRQRGGRQCDNIKTATHARLLAWRFMLYGLISRRIRRPRTVPSTFFVNAAHYYLQAKSEYAAHVLQSRQITYTVFAATLIISMTQTLFLYFVSKSKTFTKLLPHVINTATHGLTRRNRYTTTRLLTTCVLLRSLATPFRWRDVERFFGKHSSQLSEIFWEGLEELLCRLGYLLTGDIEAQFVEQNALRYAIAVQNKANALPNCIGFLDGTVLKIARPQKNSLQNVVYNGHKRTHGLKLQAVITLDGMFLHIYGPLEGRRHDWTLYSRSDLDRQLLGCMEVDGVQYWIYADIGYNWREVLEVPFQGASLSLDQAAYNKAISRVRVTVEWMFKEVKLYWTIVDFKRQLKLAEAPIRCLYRAALLLTNLRNCIYPNEMSQYFNCRPPSIKEYLTWKQVPVV